MMDNPTPATVHNRVDGEWAMDQGERYNPAVVVANTRLVNLSFPRLARRDGI
jgi:hypothetical protein